MKNVLVVNMRGMTNDIDATIFIGRKPIEADLITVHATYQDIVELARSLCGIDGLTATEIKEVELSAKQVAQQISDRLSGSDYDSDDVLMRGKLHDIEFIEYWTEKVISDDLLAVMEANNVCFEHTPTTQTMSFNISDQEIPGFVKGMISSEPDGVAICIDNCNGFDGKDTSKCTIFMELVNDTIQMRFYANKGVDAPSRIVHVGLVELADN